MHTSISPIMETMIAIHVTKAPDGDEDVAMVAGMSVSAFNFFHHVVFKSSACMVYSMGLESSGSGETEYHFSLSHSSRHTTCLTCTTYSFECMHI